MTWSKFITWLFILYGAYYIFNMIYDAVKGANFKSPTHGGDDDTLDVSALYSDADHTIIEADEALVAPASTSSLSSSEEAFEIQLSEKKSTNPIEDIYNNIAAIIPPVQSEGLTLTEIIARAKMGALEMTADIKY